MDTILFNIDEVISSLDVLTETFLSNLGIWGAIISCLLITVESMLPPLPLCLFITILFYNFGNVLGFLISWIFTCIGCFLSFSLFRCKIKNWYERKFIKGKVREEIDKIMKVIEKLSLSGLAVLVAIPFTPAFAVNIAAGLSNMPRKKFLVGIIIGKMFMVYFWGYIGTTLIESLTHPTYFFKIIIMLIVAFLVSKIVNRCLKIE